MATKQQRKTARRKARQQTALTELHRRNPGNAFVRGPLGGAIPLTHVEMLRESSKQKLVERFGRISGRP